MPITDFEPFDAEELAAIRSQVESGTWLTWVSEGFMTEMLRRLIRQAEVAYDLSTKGARCGHGHRFSLAQGNCPVCTDPMITIVREELEPLFAVIRKGYPNPTKDDEYAVRNARSQVVKVAEELCAALPKVPGS